MPIGGMATHTFRVVRRTTWLMQPKAVQATMAPDVDKCPTMRARVELILEGGPELTGDVTVRGKIDGVPALETVTFSGPMGATSQRAVISTCKAFDCVTLFETSGLVGEPGSVVLGARFIGDGGHPISINCELSDCVLGHLEPRSGGGAWPIPTPGGTEQAALILAHDDWYDFVPRRGDVYVETWADGSEHRYEVAGLEPTLLGALRPHHFEINVRQLQAEDIEIRSAL